MYIESPGTTINGRRWRSLALLVGFLTATCAGATQLNYEWAGRMGGVGSENVVGAAVDSAGNTYITGSLNVAGDFDPGAGTTTLTPASSNTDIFVVKLDSDGELLWAFSIGNTNVDTPYNLTVDSAGNVYIVGAFVGTVDFDPGAGTTSLTASATDGFLAKYDTNGGFLTAALFEATSAISSARDVVIDEADGSCYVVGQSNGTVDLDPGVGTFTLSPSGSGFGFLVKLDSTLTFDWAIGLDSTTSTSPQSVALDPSGNVLIGGSFFGTADFDPGVGTVSRTFAGLSDVFVLQLTSSGAYSWVATLGSTSYEFFADVAADSVGNVYTTGYFRGTADFDPGAGTFALTPVGGDDTFLWALDSNGDFRYAYEIGNADSEVAYALTVGPDDTVYATGMFANTVDFDPGLGDTSLTSNGGTDGYVVKFDSVGDFQYAKQVGGTQNERLKCVAVDSDDILYLIGLFSNTVDFDFGSGTANLTSAGQFDVFAAKYPPAPEVVGIEADSPLITNAGTVSFTVEFDMDVTGVDITDFALVTTIGLPDAMITGVTGSGTTYTVTVDTGSGEGTISITLADDDSILNDLLQPLGGTGVLNGDFSMGDEYTRDETAPVITLLGDNPVEIFEFEGYTEPGATATDTLDGDISGAIAINASAVNANVAGSYSVTYDVSDTAGNAASTMTRTVNVLQTPSPMPLGNGVLVTSIAGLAFLGIRSTRRYSKR